MIHTASKALATSRNTALVSLLPCGVFIEYVGSRSPPLQGKVTPGQKVIHHFTQTSNLQNKKLEEAIPEDPVTHPGKHKTQCSCIRLEDTLHNNIKVRVNSVQT
jgi:hypothetical protein